MKPEIAELLKVSRHFCDESLHRGVTSVEYRKVRTHVEKLAAALKEAYTLVDDAEVQRVVFKVREYGGEENRVLAADLIERLARNLRNVEQYAESISQHHTEQQAEIDRLTVQLSSYRQATDLAVEQRDQLQTLCSEIAVSTTDERVAKLLEDYV